MNLKVIHYIQLGLSGAVMVSQFVAQSFPQYAAIAHAAGALLTSLLGTLSVLSPSVLPSKAAQ